MNMGLKKYNLERRGSYGTWYGKVGRVERECLSLSKRIIKARELEKTLYRKYRELFNTLGRKSMMRVAQDFTIVMNHI